MSALNIVDRESTANVLVVRHMIPFVCWTVRTSAAVHGLDLCHENDCAAAVLSSDTVQRCF